jgi:hypothetical protein
MLQPGVKPPGNVARKKFLCPEGERAARTLCRPFRPQWILLNVLSGPSGRAITSRAFGPENAPGILGQTPALRSPVLREKN